jgi:hypothetical protein
VWPGSFGCPGAANHAGVVHKNARKRALPGALTQVGSGLRFCEIGLKIERCLPNCESLHRSTLQDLYCRWQNDIKACLAKRYCERSPSDQRRLPSD